MPLSIICPPTCNSKSGRGGGGVGHRSLSARPGVRRPPGRLKTNKRSKHLHPQRWHLIKIASDLCLLRAQWCPTVDEHTSFHPTMSVVSRLLIESKSKRFFCIFAVCLNLLLLPLTLDSFASANRSLCCVIVSAPCLTIFLFVCLFTDSLCSCGRNVPLCSGVKITESEKKKVYGKENNQSWG